MLCIRRTSHGPVSVRPSQVGVLLKRLNVGSHKQHQGFYFSESKDLRESRPGSPPTEAPNAGGMGQNRRLSTNNRLYFENGKDRRMVSIKVDALYQMVTLPMILNAP